MNHDDESLWYRGGYAAGKAMHIYFSRWPAWLYDTAGMYGVGGGWMKLCKFCAAVLFIFFVTDMHRYGAWYTGGATYIKPWWQFACIALWAPVAAAALFIIMGWLDKHSGEFVLLMMISAFAFLLCFMILLAIYMAEDEFMVKQGILYLRHGAMDDVIPASCIISVVFVIPLVWSYIVGIYTRAAERIVAIWHEEAGDMEIKDGR